MSLTKQTYLYRARVLFEPDGSLNSVETVHHTAILEDGVVVSRGPDTVTLYSKPKAQAAVAAFIAELARIGAEEAAEAETAKAEAEGQADGEQEAKPATAPAPRSGPRKRR